MQAKEPWQSTSEEKLTIARHHKAKGTDCYKVKPLCTFLGLPAYFLFGPQFWCQLICSHLFPSFFSFASSIASFLHFSPVPLSLASSFISPCLSPKLLHLCISSTHSSSSPRKFHSIISSSFPSPLPQYAQGLPTDVQEVVTQGVDRFQTSLIQIFSFLALEWG